MSQTVATQPKKGGGFGWFFLGGFLGIIVGVWIQSAAQTVQKVRLPSHAQPATSTQAPAKSKKVDVAWIEWPKLKGEWENGHLFNFAVGKLRNISGRNCSYISVTGSLQNAQGNHIRALHVNTLNLPAGSTWKIRHIVPDGAHLLKNVQVKADCR